MSATMVVPTIRVTGPASSGAIAGRSNLSLTDSIESLMRSKHGVLYERGA